jgi:glycosyltransferase involved in cell wall biosynthesis
MIKGRKNNIHITLTPFRNESRILKQTQSLIGSDIVEAIWICALHEEGLKVFENIDGRRNIKRFRLLSRKMPRNIVTQIFTYLEFALRIIVFSFGKKIGLINIHSLPLLPIGIIISLITRAKLVYDTHELETETDNSNGFRKKLARILERIFIRIPDLTVVVGHEIQKWYQEKYPSLNVITVLNCPRKFELEKSNLFREKLNISQDKIIVLYQGGLSKDRGIKLLIDTFSTIIEETYVLIVMGYGELENEVRDYAERFGNIYFLEAVKPEDVLRYTASADVGVHWIDDSCLNHQYCLPNKLFEYLMAGLPVVVSNLKEMKNVVQEHKVGVIIEDWNPIGFKNALYRLFELPKEELKINIRTSTEVFNWEMQENHYIKEIKNVLNA